MIAALLCLLVAASLIGLNGGERNWPALIVCAIGLWFALGGGERWMKRRAARRSNR